MLLFPQPSGGNEVYWDPKCNQKSGLYGTGILGPPHLFTTLDGDTHRALRKALGGPQVCFESVMANTSSCQQSSNTSQWTIGSLKNNWESRIDGQVQLLVAKLTEVAKRKESVCISDRVA